jgi:hypothetical protein
MTRDRSVGDEQTTSADRRDLAGFGYTQELDRTLGGFSAFAAGFSYLSILTGMFQLFYMESPRSTSRAIGSRRKRSRTASKS